MRNSRHRNDHRSATERHAHKIRIGRMRAARAKLRRRIRNDNTGTAIPRRALTIEEYRAR